jgi:hypothetical protein
MKFDHKNMMGAPPTILPPPPPPPTARQTAELIGATVDVGVAVATLGATSERLEDLTRALLETSADMKAEISAVKASSHRLEGLTERLKKLTWALIGLTIFAVVATAIAPLLDDWWKSSHEPQAAPVLAHPEPWK